VHQGRDALLGGLELLVAGAGELHALLEEAEGLLEGDLARLEPAHALLEPGEGLLEGGGVRGGVGRAHSRTRRRPMRPRRRARWAASARARPPSTGAAAWKAMRSGCTRNDSRWPLRAR